MVLRLVYTMFSQLLSWIVLRARWDATTEIKTWSCATSSPCSNDASRARARAGPTRPARRRSWRRLRHVRSGLIPAVRVGRRWLVPGKRIISRAPLRTALLPAVPERYRGVVATAAGAGGALG